MRAPKRWRSAGLAAAALAVGLASGVVAAPRLELAGTALPRGAAEDLLAPALRAPADSAALVAALGAVAGAHQDQGWLDARARGAWRGDTLAVAIDAGARYRLESVTLAAGSAEDSARVAEALGLAAGGWASPRAVAAAIETGVARLDARGWAYAEIAVRGWDADSGRVRLRLGATPGPRVTVAEIALRGLQVTRPDVARRALGPLEGRHYDPVAAAAGRERLLRLGLFRDVRYEGLERVDDWSRGRLVYAVEEPRYNAFEGVVGVQGDAGTVGRARVELGNLLGTGRALALRWESTGRERSDLAARYAEPLLLGATLGAEAALEHEVRDSTFTRTRWGGKLRWAATAREGIELGFDEERVVQGFGPVEEARLENVRFALERAVWDDAAAPRRGIRARLEAAHVFKRERLRPLGTRTARANAVEARFEWLRPVTRGSGLALELRGAGRLGSERVLPVFERWPLGGASSLRGFDEEAFRVDRYALTRAEWRAWIGTPRQHAYVFWDHAWAGTRVAIPEGGDRLDAFHADGIGVGLRLETGAGVVGLDYGVEAGRPPLEGKVHVRLVSTF